MILLLLSLLCLLSLPSPLVFPPSNAAVARGVDTQQKGIVPLRRVPTRARRRRLAKRIGQNVGLSLADGNQEFIAKVTIGTPWTNLQTFDLPVDTASSDTWIASNDFTCQDYINDCDPGAMYTPTASFVPLNASLSNQYGAGDVTGQFGTDTVTIGTFIVPSVIIAVVDAGQWTFQGTSGLLGLGGSMLTNLWYPGTDNPTNYSPLLVQMYQEGIITPNFTLAFSQTGGYLSLGTVPLPSDVAHGTTWITTPMPPYSTGPPNGTVYGYYGIQVQSLNFPSSAGRNISYTYNDWMIVDSGTSANIFPDPIADALNELWDPQPDPYDGSMPCNIASFSKVPSLGVTIGNYTFWHDPQTLIAQYPNGECGTAIMGAGDPPQGPMILGTPWLMNVVAVFDIGDEVMSVRSTNPRQM